MTGRGGRMRRGALLLATLLLCSCNAGTTAMNWNPFGANYKPIGEGVAEKAVPLPDGTGSGATVICRAAVGSARFEKQWRPFQTADFHLPPGMRVEVTLRPKTGDGTLSFQAWYDSRSQRMLFCPVIDGPPDKKVQCASVYALEEDLDAGIKRTFDIPQAVEGGELSCAHSADKLKK